MLREVHITFWCWCKLESQSWILNLLLTCFFFFSTCFVNLQIQYYLEGFWECCWWSNFSLFIFIFLLSIWSSFSYQPSSLSHFQALNSILFTKNFIIKPTSAFYGHHPSNRWRALSRLNLGYRRSCSHSPCFDQQALKHTSSLSLSICAWWYLSTIGFHLPHHLWWYLCPLLHRRHVPLLSLSSRSFLSFWDWCLFIINTYLLGIRIWINRLSYYFLFDHRMMNHPRFLKNQIKLEIQSSVRAFAPIDALALPWFLAEVRGYSRREYHFHQYSSSSSINFLFTLSFTFESTFPFSTSPTIQRASTSLETSVSVPRLDLVLEILINSHVIPSSGSSLHSFLNSYPTIWNRCRDGGHEIWETILILWKPSSHSLGLDWSILILLIGIGLPVLMFWGMCFFGTVYENISDIRGLPISSFVHSLCHWYAKLTGSSELSDHDRWPFLQSIIQRDLRLGGGWFYLIFSALLFLWFTDFTIVGHLSMLSNLNLVL